MSLHQAVRDGNLELARSLISSGAEINSQDSSKRTAAHIAAWCGNYEMVKLLALAKANFSIRAMDQFTCLHFAVQKPVSKELLKLLVRNDKTLLNARNSKGNKTALHVASSKGLIENVKALVELGADIEAKTNQGQIPYDLAHDQTVREYLKDTLNLKNDSSMKKSTRAQIDDGEGNSSGGDNNNTSDKEGDLSVRSHARFEHEIELPEGRRHGKRQRLDKQLEPPLLEHLNQNAAHL